MASFAFALSASFSASWFVKAPEPLDAISTPQSSSSLISRSTSLALFDRSLVFLIEAKERELNCFHEKG